VKFALETVGDVTVITLPGKNLDSSNSRDFSSDAAAAVCDGGKCVIDLRHVEFVDSSGCGALLSLGRKIQEARGQVKLCAASKPVRALFELVRLHRIFDVYNTREEALRAFRS
jgi:anti-sigma B factor antagonist